MYDETCGTRHIRQSAVEFALGMFNRRLNGDPDYRGILNGPRRALAPTSIKRVAMRAKSRLGRTERISPEGESVPQGGSARSP